MTAATARTRTSTSASRRTGSSAAAARTGQPRPRLGSSPANVVRPHLRVLDQQAMRRRARRRNAALAMFIVLIIGFFAAALAQAQLVANQHELDLLRTEIAEAEARRARLERSVEESSAPAAIIEPALAMGMVRAQDPIYLAAVGPAPDVVAISVLGAVTAATDGVEPHVDTVDTVEGVERGGDGVFAASAGSQVAAPSLAGLAGTQAQSAGFSSG